MRRFKRVSMAGADVAVTDRELALLVLEYAKELGRAGTTDTVTLPVARNGHAEEASLLLGPASQIAVLDNDDATLEHVDLPQVDAAVDDLRRRLDVLVRRDRYVPATGGDDGSPSFPDFDSFEY